MREIKFRAWIGEQMVIPKNIWFRDDNEIEVVRPDNKWSLVSWGNVELMQYTGLKDKNGVEIYEGDIVEDKQGIGQVGYSPPSFVVEVGEPLKYWLGGGLEYPPNYQLTDTKVIGNIYENPELLKGGN